MLIKNLIETNKIKQRHQQLVKEMKNRSYNHKSSLKNNPKIKVGKVNILKKIQHRCQECNKLINS